LRIPTIVRLAKTGDNQGMENKSVVLDKIKILIADDHAVMRQGTRKLLEQEPDLEIVAEAGDGEEAVKLATEFAPDVVILDIAMPKMDGVEATRQIRALCPNTAVLILSAYDDDEFVFGLMEAGAAGYLLKSVYSRELIAAIRSVNEGEAVLHPAIARKVMTRFVSPPPSVKTRSKETMGPLSDREMTILKLITRGLSNRAIANELHLSVRTVHGHMGQIFNKLKVNSRLEAAVRALKEGWVTLDDVPREESKTPKV